MFLLQAYITICDMLIIYSEHVTQSPQFEPLVYKPDRNLQSQLSGFLNDKVFIEDDDGKLIVLFLTQNLTKLVIDL